MHLLGGIALLIPPSITLILFGVIAEESIVSLFFAGVIPGIMLALSDAFIIVGVSLLIKLPRGKFEVRAVGRTFLEAWPALLMPVVVLGGLYGGCLPRLKRVLLRLVTHSFKGS